MWARRSAADRFVPGGAVLDEPSVAERGPPERARTGSPSVRERRTGGASCADVRSGPGRSARSVRCIGAAPGGTDAVASDVAGIGISCDGVSTLTAHSRYRRTDRAVRIRRAQSERSARAGRGREHAVVNRRLAKFLHRTGVSDEEAAQAEKEKWLTLLALDRLCVPGERRYDMKAATDRAGLDLETARRLWRALGFPDLPREAKAFTDDDLAALRALGDRMRNDILRAGDTTDTESLVQFVRSASNGLARVAEVLSDQIATGVADAESGGLTDEQTASILVDRLDWPNMARLLEYALRLQLRATLWRKLADGASTGSSSTIAVGFVDLVGYTAMSQELDATELSDLLAHFEEVSHDTVAELGGRVVKMIGDEVMFVADDPFVAAEIALRLIDRRTDDPLPDARAGLAWGECLARDGDYYGSVVNLAHRIVEVARPASVVISEALRDVLDLDERFDLRRLRSRKLAGIGRAEMYSLRRTDVEAVEA